MNVRSPNIKRMGKQKQSDINKSANKVRKFFLKEKRLPSYSEIASIFGYASKNSSFKLVNRLIEHGFIEKSSNGRLVPKRLMPPLGLYGNIKAGFPSPAEDELIDTISFDEYLVDNPDASFILKVSGDSMIEAGINPGDLVIIEKGRQPKRSEIVLARVDGEWTLKYFDKRGGKVFLRAANPDYPNIYPKEELTIGGIVKAVVRKYS